MIKMFGNVAFDPLNIMKIKWIDLDPFFFFSRRKESIFGLAWGTNNL